MSKKALAALVLTLSMLLSACGASNSGELDKVQVDLKGGTEPPSVSFSTPFSSDHEATHVLDEGQGESIEDEDTILVNASIFNGQNGNLEDSTYSKDPLTLQVGKLKEASPNIYNIIKSMKVGGSFVYTTNVDQASTQSPLPTLTPGSATNVEVYTVTSKVPHERDIPKYAQGTQQAPDPKLPSFSLNEDTGQAELKFADDRGEAPQELVSQVLIEGNGAELQETDMVIVRYIGAQWSDGKVFDNNYNGQIAPFRLNGVIKGWTQGLKGKKVGSRVELVIPADLAYGNEGQNGTPQGTLVFVVDILAAVPTVSPSQDHSSSSTSPAAVPSSTVTTSETPKQ